MVTEGPVRVRIIGTTGQQLLGAAIFLALVSGVVVAARWKNLAPLAATRTARKMRRVADRLENAGLDIAAKYRSEP